MGTCYSSINKLETTNSSKRPYINKSFIQKSISQNSNCHHLNNLNQNLNNSLNKNSLNNQQLITPSYLATISNNKLITINNQTNELKPSSIEFNSTATCLEENSFYFNNKFTNTTAAATNQLIKMYENKNNKLISKLPKFNLTNRHQVHDSSNQLNSTKIAHHFGAKQTLNADLLRLKNGCLNNKQQQQNKSSQSSLTNSETSCASSLSTNSTASYSNQTNKLNNKKSFPNSTFNKATSSSNLNDKKIKQSSSGKVINKQPTSKNNQHQQQQQQLNFNHHHHSSINKLNNNKLDNFSAVQLSQALTKSSNNNLITSKFTTTVTNIPKPQIAQRIPNNTLIQKSTNLPSNHSKLIQTNNLLYQNLDHHQQPKSSLRPYTLNENYQPYKKPAKRIDNNQEIKLGNTLRYPYSESNLKNKVTFNHHSNDDNKSTSYFKNSQLLNNNKKLNSYSGLPVPTNSNLRSSKSELRDYSNHPIHSNNSKNNSNSSLNRQSNDRLNQLNETSRSLTLEKNENLNTAEKENQKRLSTSYESSFTIKELSEKINHVRSHNKLLDQQQQQNLNKQQNHYNLSNAHNQLVNLQNLVNKKQQQLINNSRLHKQATPNSIETTDDSINEQSISCTNSQKSSQSPNSSLTPDLSSQSKVSPEHNRSENQIYLDDEICDQPDLMFLNSKENSTANSPVKENVNLIDNLCNENGNYKTNIRYSISELDSLKLKQEFLSSISEQQQNDRTDSTSPEKSSISLSPVKFRKPRPLSVVESEDGNLALDGSSFRSVMQDINGIKTLLFRLQGELQSVSFIN